MDRRKFIQRMAALSALHVLPGSLRAEASAAWIVGFEGVQSDLAAVTMHLRGKFPAHCRGTLYRNGPALFARGGQRYQHWFDPDGMVQAFRINDNSVEHRGRFVRTQRFVEEEQAERFLYNGAGTHFKNALPIRNNETTNVANTSVQLLNGELLAMWEAGAPYRLDPDSLTTLGQLEFNADLSGVPFSAHPHFDDKGELWNIGSVPFARHPTLLLYHVSAQGRLIKSRVHRLEFPGYMHDFVLTPHFVIALNSSAVFGPGETIVDRMQWKSEQPSQLLVFNKEDFSLTSTIEIPPTFVFHFGNAWEDGGNVHFTACAYENMDIVSIRMRQLAQQRADHQHTAAELLRYSLSLTRGTVQIERLRQDMEFPGFDVRRPFAAQTIHGVGDHRQHGSQLPSSVLSVDPQTGDVAKFDYGDGVIVEEPLLIPGPEGGYLLHSFLDYANQRSGVAVLRATRLEDGPIATADMDRILPIGFHGCFRAA